MVAEEYRAIAELIAACQDGKSDVLELLHEWHGLDPVELLRAQSLLSLELS
jgi:hypothetical protein